MRLRYQGFVIASDKAQIFDAVGEIPLVIEGLPLSLATESTHRRRLASLILAGKRHFVRPAAQLGAIGIELAVDFVDAELLANEAWHHATPAAVRIDVTSIS